MPLREELEQFLQGVLPRIPADIQAVMQEEAERLAESGIAAKALQPGDKAPAFSLPNINDSLISSEVLLASGPLVVSFYRGGW